MFYKNTQIWYLIAIDQNGVHGWVKDQKVLEC